MIREIIYCILKIKYIIHDKMVAFIDLLFRLYEVMKICAF